MGNKQYFIRQTPNKSSRVYIQNQHIKQNSYTFLKMTSLWMDDLISVEKALDWHGFEVMEECVESVTTLLEKLFGFEKINDPLRT